MKKLLSLILCISILLSGCGKPVSFNGNTSQTKNNAANPEFDNFTNQLFISQMCGDALSANYTLAHPENFGVTNENPSLGNVSTEGLKAALAENENLLHSLLPFKKQKLSLSQRVLYNNLDLSLRHGMKENHFLYLHQYLSPTIGVQAQLPVLLCEFHLDEKKDFDTYFSILKSVPLYFGGILSYEEEKAKKHMATCSSTMSRIILQCKNFIEKPKENILITNFSERLKEMTFLSNEEKKDLIETNKKIVTEQVLPAYENLITGLEKLLANARPDGGLSEIRNGKAYYAYLFQSSVGSMKSIPQAKKIITEALNTSRSALLTLAKKRPELFSRSSLLASTTNTPKEILASLEKSIQANFPATSKTNYTVRYVPKSLENFLSPAFYLTPPIDNSTDNVIYINGSAKYENSNLFPTLAHEGFPGHLYQSVYLSDHLSSPLQGTLNFGGYTEGWATYAEIYSFQYAGLEKEVVEILRNNTIVSLCLYTLCDIGIHYEGWDLTQTGKFLERYGITDVTDILTVYQNLIDEPSSYPKYCMGYLEILELKKKAKKLLGKKYTDKAFHTWFLSMGPSWFDVLDAYMEPWFEENKIET